MSKKKFDVGEGIYDAKQLGYPRMGVLGVQHMFAMFGATVLVPILVQGYGLFAWGLSPLIVGLLLGWFTAQMLLQRTVRVLHKKTLRGLLAFALAMGTTPVIPPIAVP